MTEGVPKSMATQKIQKEGGSFEREAKQIWMITGKSLVLLLTFRKETTGNMS
jgi:hypothetical protein